MSVNDSDGVDLVLSMNRIDGVEKILGQGAVSICIQKALCDCSFLKDFCERDVTSFALEFVPRTTRAQYMDVLSSQSSLAGYIAVIEASHLLGRAIPLMMTSAGTIPAAKVLVVGVGVAGLQAIATSKRLGAIVSAFDVRSSAKEQAESLGAKFIEVGSEDVQTGVYASEVSAEYRRLQKEKLESVLPSQDIVITTAQIPGKRAPLILTCEMMKNMKKGSVIIDLASETGGNCECTKHGETVNYSGVRVISFLNILNLIAHDASMLFSKNVCAFVRLITENMEKSNGDLLSSDDDIIKSTLLTHRGSVVNERVSKYVL
jgi:NAD(P) transhydrogenase subunit alpha